ncbi:MAG: hypothetical protein R2710_31325, partial [Acidimicrobiales bacterium]
MFTIHATKKLLDRVKQPVEEPVAEPSTALGNWYATALFWRPQAALFVNERTLLPVFVPLAPAAKVASRLPDQLGRLLDALEIPLEFTLQETAAMETANFAKTANRSVVGSMNDFVFLAEHYLADGFPHDLLALSLRMAGTPCGPLRKSTGFPDLEVAAVVDEVLGR